MLCYVLRWLLCSTNGALAFCVQWNCLPLLSDIHAYSSYLLYVIQRR
jgi:hypothetical protein